VAYGELLAGQAHDGSHLHVISSGSCSDTAVSISGSSSGTGLCIKTITILVCPGNRFKKRSSNSSVLLQTSADYAAHAIRSSYERYLYSMQALLLLHHQRERMNVQ
jgi:hypothetical protein